jgi:hypothetical protein
MSGRDERMCSGGEYSFASVSSIRAYASGAGGRFVTGGRDL